ISRSPGHQRHEFVSSRCFMLAVDMQAFSKSGVIELPGECFTAIVGDPVVSRDDDERRFDNRFDDAKYLAQGLTSGTRAVLTEASGTFAGAHFDIRSNRLVLFTDKLGIRPVYVAITDQFVAFSSALRILEDLALVPKRLDLKAVVEQVALHWILDHRSRY